MSKKITSPVEKFSGTVTLKDPIPLDACVTWEEARGECGQRVCPKGIALIQSAMSAKDEKKAAGMSEFTTHFVECSGSDRKPRCREALTGAAMHARMIPAIKGCVEEWNVPDFQLVNPPGSPRAARAQFIEWLIAEIETLYNDNGLNAVDPNE